MKASCDLCGRWDLVIDMEIVLVAKMDGAIDPEGWCHECTVEAFAHGAL